MALSIDTGVKSKFDLTTIADEIRFKLELANREVAKALLTALAIETPKKTGRATGEWQVTIDEKAKSLTNRYDLTGLDTVATGIAIIDSSSNEVFPDIWISNLIDYILDLNDGKSTQAPAKFIQTAEIKALASIDKVSI